MNRKEHFIFLILFYLFKLNNFTEENKNLKKNNMKIDKIYERKEKLNQKEKTRTYCGRT